MNIPSRGGVLRLSGTVCAEDVHCSSSDVEITHNIGAGPLKQWSKHPELGE